MQVQTVFMGCEALDQMLRGKDALKAAFNTLRVSIRMPAVQSRALLKPRAAPPLPDRIAVVKEQILRLERACTQQSELSNLSRKPLMWWGYVTMEASWLYVKL